jgi:NTE family protein
LIPNPSVFIFTVFFGDAVLSDLKIPIQITATDMVRKTKIFAQYKIVDAILASSAFRDFVSV